MPKAHVVRMSSLVRMLLPATTQLCMILIASDLLCNETRHIKANPARTYRLHLRVTGENLTKVEQLTC